MPQEDSQVSLKMLDLSNFAPTQLSASTYVLLPDCSRVLPGYDNFPKEQEEVFGRKRVRNSKKLRIIFARTI